MTRTNPGILRFLNRLLLSPGPILGGRKFGPLVALKRGIYTCALNAKIRNDALLAEFKSGGTRCADASKIR